MKTFEKKTFPQRELGPDTIEAKPETTIYLEEMGEAVHTLTEKFKNTTLVECDIPSSIARDSEVRKLINAAERLMMQQMANEKHRVNILLLKVHSFIAVSTIVALVVIYLN